MGGRLFRRPKLTLSCSTEGKDGKDIIYCSNTLFVINGETIERKQEGILTCKLKDFSTFPV
jgi:hypothetical protein